MNKRITINGMHCAGCVNSVEKAVGRVDGVQNVTVQLATDTAIIEYEGDYPAGEIKEAVGNAGYEIVDESESGEITFDIGGMHCTGCSAAVEKAVGKLKGVENVTVNLAAEKAFIKYNPDGIQPEQIANRIEEAGYEVIRQKKKQKTG